MQSLQLSTQPSRHLRICAYQVELSEQQIPQRACERYTLETQRLEPKDHRFLERKII